MDDIDVSFGNDVTMKGGVSAKLGHVDQYELIRELGGGGFGCVYLAKDTVAGIEVAVKGLPPEVKHNKEELENIRENFALVSRLHHPNIAAALVLHPAKEVSYASRDVMEKLRVFEGDTLMVMEYAPGSTLSSWRKQFPGKRVPAKVAVDIVRQVASALDYAHARKIVHRDIKPGNVMIEQVGADKYDIRVLDFGLAAEIRSSMGRVSREIRDMSGTRPYMAPEQWGGERQGPATDQYALAVMFCELVSGEVPYQSAFESGDSVVMMANVIHQPLKLPEAVPDNFRKTLVRALAKKPEKRFPACADFVDALGGRRFSWMPIVLGGLLVVLCAAVCWRFVLRERSVREREVTSVETDDRLTSDLSPWVAETNVAVSVANDVPAGPTEGDKAREEVARKAKEEADRKAREEAARKAKEEADRKAREEAVRKAKEETDRKAREETVRKTKEEADRKAREETVRKAKEEADRKAREETVRKAKEEADRKAREETVRKAKEETVRKAKDETDRKAREEAAKLPPALRIVARIDGREVSGAKMKTLSGEVVLPCKWEGRIFRGRSLGPYDVTYREGTTDYHGEFKVSVDWAGEKTAYVDLIRGKLAEKYKGTGRWF